MCSPMSRRTTKFAIDRIVRFKVTVRPRPKLCAGDVCLCLPFASETSTCFSKASNCCLLLPRMCSQQMAPCTKSPEKIDPETLSPNLCVSKWGLESMLFRAAWDLCCWLEADTQSPQKPISCRISQARASSSSKLLAGCPKPETLNPKPSILNPKPESSGPGTTQMHFGSSSAPSPDLSSAAVVYIFKKVAVVVVVVVGRRGGRGGGAGAMGFSGVDGQGSDWQQHEAIIVSIVPACRHCCDYSVRCNS